MDSEFFPGNLFWKEKLRHSYFSRSKMDDYHNDDVMSYITVQNTDKLDTFVENLRGNSIFKSSKKQYLTIKNAGNSTVKFCIKKVYNNDDNIPYSHYLIDVQWHYGDMEVWLQSVVKKDIPSWALNVLWL